MTTSVQPFGYSTDASKSRRRKPRVPESLIRDTINGVPFYFRDYQQVLRKHKTLDVVPKFVIEVDMRVSLDDTAINAFTEFLSLKTQKLFDFGVERLIWVLTPSKKVLIAMPGEDWLLVDWHKDIELWNGIKANIGTFLAQKGIQTP